MGADDIFTSEDATLDTWGADSIHRRRQRRPPVAFDPDFGPEHDLGLLQRAAAVDDARNAAQYLAEPREDEPRRGFLGRRLSQPQFGPLSGLGETYERMAEDPIARRVAPSMPLMRRPAEYVTQANWEKGMGNSWTERNFSPRARAQGHLLGAAAMFAAVAPPLAERPTVSRIDY